jgi:hypothetical protein
MDFLSQTRRLGHKKRRRLPLEEHYGKDSMITKRKHLKPQWSLRPIAADPLYSLESTPLFVTGPADS